MGILVDESSRILVQGITGREGSFHASGCRAYGTNVVAGVTPGRGGQLFEDAVPIFDSVEDAVRDICDAFKKGILPNSLEGHKYINVKSVQNIGLK